MIKKASVTYPIHELIQNRWSPYRFTDQAVSNEDLLSLFEAARWAPSSYNEQPWRYILATKRQPEEFKKILSCLLEGNQVWARHAYALVLASASLTHERNGKDNQAALYDLGASVAYLSLEAVSRGISVHQIIGINPDIARDIYKIPSDYRTLTAFAIGIVGAGDKETNDMYAERDNTARARNDISKFVYMAEWESPWTE